MLRKKSLIILSFPIILFFLGISFWFAGYLLEIVVSDIQSVLNIKILTLRAGEILFTQLQIAFWLFLFMLSPILIGGFYSYAKDALYLREQRIVKFLYVPLGVLMLGSIAGYYVSLYLFLPYLYEYNIGLSVESTLTLAYMVEFLLHNALIFSVVVSVPFILKGLIHSSIVSKSYLRKSWKGVTALFFILSMLITPGDPISLFAVALPAITLYGLSVI